MLLLGTLGPPPRAQAQEQPAKVADTGSGYTRLFSLEPGKTVKLRSVENAARPPGGRVQRPDQFVIPSADDSGADSVPDSEPASPDKEAR